VSARMLGVESEYALVGLTRRHKAVDREQLLSEFVRLAREQAPHARGCAMGDMYLANGARFYVDCGHHPEFTTPECTNPWDIVRYVLAGEHILAGLCARLPDAIPEMGEAGLYRCNVDYSGSGSTWGCHESYLHRADPALLPPQIIPHLVSRVIYSGAGGFDPRSPSIEFALSPRAFHIQRTVSSESTVNRGIFHTKDEPLCRGGYHRLHLLCGESLCSEIASWLKVGTTALVVAMVEGGLRPGDGIELRAPLEALRTFATDTTCRAGAEMSDRRRISAIAIQRHYLALAEANLGHGSMPPWSAEVCRRWREMLDRLQADPGSLSRTLDWAIKLELYRNHARRRGCDWDSFPSWTHVVEKIVAELRNTEYNGIPVRVEFLLGPDSPIRDTIRRLGPYLRRRSLTWDGLRPFVDLRQELFEIDFKFGQLGPQGIFTALDRAGVLAHRVPGVDNIEHATSHPPAEGRARLRGEVIRRLSGKPRVRCDWQRVWDGAGRRVLDLSDPFATEERWEDATVGSSGYARILFEDLF